MWLPRNFTYAAPMPPDAADQPLDVLLGRALRSMRHTWTAQPEELDLAPHQGRALMIVAESGPLRLSELAERLRIAPRSATEVADALQERGLVTRSADPSDRRAVLLSVTEAGQHAAGAVAESRRAGAEAFFGRLSAADRASLTRILTTLVQD